MNATTDGASAQQEALESLHSSAPETVTTDNLAGDSPLIGRLCMIALAIIFGWAVYESYSMGVGTLTNPGPGMWPLGASSISLALSLLLVVRGSTWSASGGGTYLWVGTLAGALVIYALILPVIGYLVATSALCLVVTRFIGGSRWISSILTSAITPVCSYLLFNVVMGVPLIPSVLF